MDGTVCGLKHDGVPYYFYKNLQSDVIAITDDAETKLYYLQSRYYNPAVGRFINADSIESGSLTVEMLFNNLFLYCENDVANNKDENGNVSWKKVTSFLEGFVKVIKKIVDWLKKAVGELLKIYTGLKWQAVSSIAKDIGRSPL